ncbi:PAS domain-containing protein [Polaribacter sp.]|uniref:PAS domain-containing protein n=1 Tax=Polaribacter sp. TaxID=1920175 RepID=UPI003EF7DEE3
MNYSQIAVLFLQGTVVAAVILLLFRLRRRLGIGVLFACLGLFQFVQVFLSSTVYITITKNLIVSPGSSVFFTATLFALLIIYIKEDASETKKIIYALFIVNIVMSFLLESFGWYFEENLVENAFKLSKNVFEISAWVLFVGTIVLFLDSLLMIIIFEFVSKKVRFLFVQICITMLVVVSFDTVLFSLLAFWGFENLESILFSGLISKGVFTVFYSILFYFYLKYFDAREPFTEIFKVKDVFQPLTYKQKFESASQTIKKAEEAREVALLISNKEKEKRIVQLEQKEHSLSEASKVAKIGYQEYDIATDTYKWSDYVFEIYGLDPKNGVPTVKEILSIFDKDSQERITKAAKKLSSEGIPCDIELRCVHNTKEVVWLRYVANAVYNQQNIIVGRRGVVQNITDSKKAQLELELSKQKIQTSLDLLKRKEFALEEVSAIAKIGYWEYDNDHVNVIWSDYHYEIFGLDPEKGIPPREELFAFFDKESQEKIREGNLNLVSQGISFDIELKLINLKKEEVWVRNVVQPVYNQQIKVVGRRGLLQNITDYKRAQIELELSKEKIQTSLNLLEKSQHSLQEASKLAKIGYWEYDIATDTFTWSDYMYQMYGLDLKDGIPSREEIYSFYDIASQKKIEQAIQDVNVIEGSCDVELKFINLKNEEIWERTTARSIYNQQNELVGRVGVMQNITDWKNAQFELELSKQKIQDSLDLLEKRDYSLTESSRIAKIGHWEYDIASDTFIWSDYVYEVYGFELEESIPSRKEMVGFYDKESQKKLAQATQDLTSKGIPYDIELKLTNKKKKEVWVRNVVQLIYNDQNEIIGRRGVVHNITASKNAQLELELSKEKIQTSLILSEKRKYSMDEASKIARIGYWEHDLLTDTVVWSEYMHRIFGSNAKDGIPLEEEILKNFKKESQEKLIQATLNLTSKGISYDLELQYINSKKEIIWIRNVAQPIYNNHSKIVGKRGVLQNITASKNAQQEIEFSKQKLETTLKLLEKKEYSLRKASEIAKIGYQEYVSATDTFTWSDYVYAILRFDIKQGIPSREEIWENFDDESRKLYKQATLALIAKGTPFDLELKFITKNKEEVWVRNVVQPVYNKQNKIIGRRGVLQDITTTKKSQFDLERSKRNIQTSLELLEKSEYSKNEASKMAKIGYIEYDIATDTFVWSEFLYVIFGLDANHPIPSRNKIMTFFDIESQKKMKQVTLDLDLNGIPYDVELKIINKKNKEVWVRMIVQPVYNKQKKVIGRRGVIQDITERKKIVEEHLRVKDNYRRLFDNATVSIWNEDFTQVFKEIETLRKQQIPNIKIYLEQHPDVLSTLLVKLKINSVNEATLKLYKVKNYEDFLINYPETLGTGAEKVFANLIEAIWNYEKMFLSEVNFKTLNGDEFAALISIPIPQTEIEQKTVPVSIQSIQSVKDAESAKRESLNKLKEAQELAQVGSWSHNLITQESEWSDETFRIWDFDVSKPTPTGIEILNRIHKDDHEHFNNAVELVNTKAIPYDIEFRICLPNNVEKTIRSICKPIFGETGEVVSLKGTNQDITEQKRIRSEIEKAEEMYRILTDNSNDLICLQEPDSTFRYVSPSIKNLLGYEQSEFLGKQMFSIVHEDDVQLLKDAMKQINLGGKVDGVSYRVRHKNGHFIWLESLASLVSKEKNNNYYVTSSRDITQAVIAKQKIEEYQTSLQKLTTEMTLIEEQQKKEIATNIHDHLSQSLVISKMKINALKKMPQLKLINDDLNFIETHISEALENSRKITYELSPPVLYQLGIIEALYWLFDNVETTHKIACVVSSNVDNIKLNEVKSILLYRSIQEVLTNVIKYAKATKVTLDIDKNKQGVDIVIKDNGIGFDTSILTNIHNHSGSGFGLFTVQERIKNIQGRFTIKSKINFGTTVKLFIPLSK